MKKCNTGNCRKEKYRRMMCRHHYTVWLKKDKIHTTRLEMIKDRKAIICGDIAKIPLGVNAKDGYAIIDKEYVWLADKYKWSLSDGYAKQSIHTRKRLHHFIMNEATREKMVDHINGDTLDNRKSNLRYVSHSQNIFNARGQRDTKSKYKGVSTSGNKWRAYIKPNGKQIIIGYYDTQEEAAKAYDKEALKHWGEYAFLNIPE